MRRTLAENAGTNPVQMVRNQGALHDSRLDGPNHDALTLVYRVLQLWVPFSIKILGLDTIHRIPQFVFYSGSVPLTSWSIPQVPIRRSAIWAWLGVEIYLTPLMFHNPRFGYKSQPCISEIKLDQEIFELLTPSASEESQTTDFEDETTTRAS